MQTILTALTGDYAPLSLLMLSAATLLGLTWLSLRSAYIARIGLRNAFRRPARSLLIVFGLMLATTFVSTALLLDNAITLAIENVAVYSLGRVDEEVTGGAGPLGLYPQTYSDAARQALAHDPRVASVTPAIAVSNLLLVDEATRQSRGDVYGVAIAPDQAGPLGALRPADASARHDAPPPHIGDLGPTDLYLNAAVARLLGAQPGDTVALYSTYWPGQRHQFTLRAIVNGGPLGQQPSLLLSLGAAQTLLAAPGSINRIYIANAGDGLSGVQYSDAIAARLTPTLRAFHAGLHIRETKRDGVRFALAGQQLFSRILTLYTLFALAISLLLIFLIFALLATERRVEMGTVRALGGHRLQIVELLLFEGAVYGLAACVPGLLLGMGLGAFIVRLVAPTVAQFGLPLHFQIDPSALIIAACLGLLFTLLASLLAIWAVSRMTIAAALRGLPEPPHPQPSIRTLLLDLGVRLRRRDAQASASASARLIWAACVRGWLPLALAYLLLRLAPERQTALTLAAAVTAALIGGALFLRWLVTLAAVRALRQLAPQNALRLMTRFAARLDAVSALLIGAGMALYWALPFDALSLPRFDGGMEIFFIASLMMTLGAALALIPNLRVLLRPLLWLVKRVGWLRHTTYIALVYPASQRFRTGIGLSMFSLVYFTMVVMACIAASTTQQYGDYATQSAGYAIIGQPLFQPVGGVAPVRAALAAHAPTAAADVTALSAATPLPLTVIQPGAQNARWGVYPAAELQGDFLAGVGLPLAARASGYASDAAIWRAVRDQPGAVVLDSGALSPHDAAILGIQRPAPVGVQQFVAPPIASGLFGYSSLETLLGRSAALDAQNRVPPDVRDIISDPNKLALYSLRVTGVALGQGVFTPIPLWIADPRGAAPLKVTVVGIVDNANEQTYGLLGSPQTFAPIEQGLPTFSSAYYFFRLRSGADARADALAIGSALLDYGFETTVIHDALQDLNAPQIFASKTLEGLVALTLLVGMAALGVAGLRAVAERRQQIGMLRALGYHKLDVRLLFTLESLLVGGGGAALGLTLALLLCRNIFAGDFFAQFHAGLTLVVPWGQLGVMCVLALAAALLAAFAPAFQASRVSPADALRYE